MTSFATNSNGTRIAYSTTGRPWRAAVILTHSLGSDRRMWQPQAAVLAETYYVISVDNIGHGESDVPAGDYSVAQMADGVLAVADSEEVEAFHFCGLSVGGLTGQWIATRHDERLLSLTLSNTGAKIGTAELWNGRIETARSVGMDGLVDAVVERWFSPDFPERDPETFAQARATLRATDPNGYAGVCAAIRDADLTGDLANITAPTLIVGGLRDQATPVEQARELHRAISASRLVELDAAHISNLDRREEFTAALERFIRETTP